MKDYETHYERPEVSPGSAEEFVSSMQPHFQRLSSEHQNLFDRTNRQIVEITAPLTPEALSQIHNQPPRPADQ